MKVTSALFIVLGIASFGSALAEGEHKTPTAPAEFLEMTNPYDVDDVDEDVLTSAKKIYKRKCKKCHGTDGDGKGSSADDMEIKPTAFNEPGFLASRKDGQLYWISLEGSEGTDMEAFGPGTDVNLSEEELWQVITYIRSSFTN